MTPMIPPSPYDGDTSRASLGRQEEVVGGGARWSLPIQPDVFEAPAVVDAVDLQQDALDLRRPAGVGDVVADDRPGRVVGQLLLDLPHDLLALLDIGFGRLLVDQLVDLGILVAGVVAV